MFVVGISRAPYSILTVDRGSLNENDFTYKKAGFKICGVSFTIGWLLGAKRFENIVGITEFMMYFEIFQKTFLLRSCYHHILNRSGEELNLERELVGFLSALQLPLFSSVSSL